MRFEEDLVQREIAERVGLSQMQVSRSITASINALRETAHSSDRAASRFHRPMRKRSGPPGRPRHRPDTRCTGALRARTRRTGSSACLTVPRHGALLITGASADL